MRLLIIVYFTIFNIYFIQAQTKDVLKNIAPRIEQLFAQAIIASETKKLDSLVEVLKKESNAQNQSLVDYWTAYISFKQAIIHSEREDKKASKQTIFAGVDLLENKNTKNDEDYALQAYLMNFAIQFKKGMAAGFYSSKIKKTARKALELNPDNMRAYLVLGTNDFFTPKQFGGGKKAEDYYLKALSLKAQATPNPYLPSWGKNEVYNYLIWHYTKVEDWASAKKYFKEGLELYPNDYRIKRWTKKLEGK